MNLSQNKWTKTKLFVLHIPNIQWWNRTKWLHVHQKGEERETQKSLVCTIYEVQWECTPRTSWLVAGENSIISTKSLLIVGVGEELLKLLFSVAHVSSLQGMNHLFSHYPLQQHLRWYWKLSLPAHMCKFLILFSVSQSWDPRILISLQSTPCAKVHIQSSIQDFFLFLLSLSVSFSPSFLPSFALSVITVTLQSIRHPWRAIFFNSISLIHFCIPGNILRIVLRVLIHSGILTMVNNYLISTIPLILSLTKAKF